MKSIFISLTLSALCLSCSQMGAGSGPSSNPGISDTKTVLEGTWKSICKETSPGSGDYQINSLTVVGGNFTMTLTNYGGSTNCSSPLYVVYNAGTFALDATEITNPAGAKSLDFTSTTIFLTPSTPAMATALNSASYCGVTNWTSEMAVQLLGKTCDTKTYPATSYIDYSIYLVAGNILSLGDATNPATDGSDPSKRPTTYDALTLTKQ